MSAPPVSIHDAICEQKRGVSFRLLLGLYSIIPICLILQCLDSWFWGDYLRLNLPSSASHVILFQVLFGTPHIIASNLILFSNRDYFYHFRRPIVRMSLAIGLATLLGKLLLPWLTLYASVALWTVHHVLKQQYGIARGICQLPEWLYRLLHLSVFAGFAVYLSIFLRINLDGHYLFWIKHCAGISCVILFIIGFIYQNHVPDRLGKFFYWANIFLVLTSFYLFEQQQYFMAVLVPRLVHDTTAYIFYVTHDINKHQRHPQNIIYQITCRLNIPLVIVLPGLSFGLAFILQIYGDTVVNHVTRYLFGTEFYKVVTMGFLGYLALMHYYMESLTWHKESPYRKFISFKK